MTSEEAAEYFVQTYGDLIYDLCKSVLHGASNTQLAFRAILKKLCSTARFQKFERHERSWVLRVVCQKLLHLYEHQGIRVTPQEQIDLDGHQQVSIRLKEFETYFHRLMPEDQILLLLKDKYNLPYWEIATAMVVPEGSLKIKRQQALRALEEWVWNKK